MGYAAVAHSPVFTLPPLNDSAKLGVRAELSCNFVALHYLTDVDSDTETDDEPGKNNRIHWSKTLIIVPTYENREIPSSWKIAQKQKRFEILSDASLYSPSTDILEIIDKYTSMMTYISLLVITHDVLK